MWTKRTRKPMLAAIACLLLSIGAIDLSGAARATGGASMTRTQTEATMAAFAEALSRDATLGGYLASDATLISIDDGRQVTGAAAVAEALAALHGGPLAAHSRVTSLVVGDGSAMLEASLDGVQVGAYDGRPPTGRVVHAPYAASFDLSDGRIETIRLYFSTSAVQRQLGGRSRIM
jgi:SnoaL-like protein